MDEHTYINNTDDFDADLHDEQFKSAFADDLSEINELNGNLELTEMQTQVYIAMFYEMYKNIVICAGRRSGKSFIAKVLLQKFALDRKNLRILCLAVTHAQARKLFFEPIVGKWKSGKCIKEGMFPKAIIANVDTQGMTASLKNGTDITCCGSENYDSLVGSEYELIVYDEMALYKPEVYGYTSPMVEGMSIVGLDGSYGGHQVLLSTPRGHNHFKEVFDLGDEDSGNKLKNWKSFHVTAENSGRYTKEQIESLKSSLGADQYLSEMMASFDNASGKIYKDFDKNKNVLGTIKYDRKKPIEFGIDFNTMNYCVTICQTQENGDLWVIDEIVRSKTNTYEIRDELIERYGGVYPELIAYPDPMGDLLKTSSRTSDHRILASAGMTIKAKKKVFITDRLNAMNAKICTTNGDRSLYVHPRCKQLIKALNTHAYDPKTGKPEKHKDKSKDLSDIVDGIGYLVEFKWPSARPKFGEKDIKSMKTIAKTKQEANAYSKLLQNTRRR